MNAFCRGGMRFHGHSSSIHHPPRCMPFLQLATTPIQQIYLSIYLADASMHTRSSSKLAMEQRVEQSKTRVHAVGPCPSHLSLPSVAQSASHQLRTLGVLFISLHIPLSLKVKECHSSRKYLCHYETTWWQPSTTATATATIEHAKHETILIRNFGSKLLLLHNNDTDRVVQIWRPCTKLSVCLDPRKGG